MYELVKLTKDIMGKYKKKNQISSKRRHQLLVIIGNKHPNSTKRS